MTLLKLRDYNETHHALSGYEMIDAVKGAIATNEVNAAMGIIVQRQQLVPRVPSGALLIRKNT